MEHYIAFFINHWVLSSLFILALIIVILYELKDQATGPKRMDASQLVNAINDENAVVIDLRDVTPFKKGHIINALNINANELTKDDAKFNEYKSRYVVLVCQDGQLSLRTALQLMKKGFENINILRDGMKTWFSANLPLEKK